MASFGAGPVPKTVVQEPEEAALGLIAQQRSIREDLLVAGHIVIFPTISRSACMRISLYACVPRTSGSSLLHTGFPHKSRVGLLVSPLAFHRAERLPPVTRKRPQLTSLATHPRRHSNIQRYLGGICFQLAPLNALVTNLLDGYEFSPAHSSINHHSSSGFSITC